MPGPGANTGRAGSYTALGRAGKSRRAQARDTRRPGRIDHWIPISVHPSWPAGGRPQTACRCRRYLTSLARVCQAERFARGESPVHTRAPPAWAYKFRQCSRARPRWPAPHRRALSSLGRRRAGPSAAGARALGAVWPAYTGPGVTLCCPSHSFCWSCPLLRLVFSCCFFVFPLSPFFLVPSRLLPSSSQCSSFLSL